MGSWKDKLQEKIDWHKAELDPRDKPRQQKRDEYDEKYGKAGGDKPNDYGR